MIPKGILLKGGNMTEAQFRELGRGLRVFHKSPLARDPKRLKAFALLLRTEISDQLSKPGKGTPKRVRKVQYSYVGTKRAKLGPVLPGAKPLAAVGEIKKRRRSGKQYFHAPSLPGDPPAPDTNTLKRSAYVEQSGPARFAVGVAVKYAAALEWGTLKLRARPFMRPALANALRKVGLLR